MHSQMRLESIHASDTPAGKHLRKHLSYDYLGGNGISSERVLKLMHQSMFATIALIKLPSGYG